MTSHRRSEVVEQVLGRRDELLQALGRLEGALNTPAGRPGWEDVVRAATASVRDAWEAHVRVTEGPGGLFEEVAQTAPRLINHIEVLRAEHAGIAEVIVEALSRKMEPADVRENLIDLLAQVVRHRHKGADLLYEAYNVDVSAGD